MNRKEKGIIRHRVYERSGGYCEECHDPIIEESGYWNSMHAHHKVHKSKGGTFEESNLQALCITCHLVGKHNPKSVPKKELIQ